MGPQAGRAALVIAAVVCTPLLFGGLLLDDYIHQLLVESTPYIPGNRWELFTFAWGDVDRLRPYIEHGPFPWWTYPGLKFQFFRPLSGLLANVDHLAFGRAFFWHHLHSLLWYLGLVAVVTALLRRALGPASAVAALAAVLFAFDDAHWMAVGWLANRNALISAVPALLGVLAHVRWRESGWRLGVPLSMLGYLTGLAGGEAAIAAMAYLAAYELTVGPGGWGARVRALVPSAIVGVAYLTVYKLIGAGSSGSGLYLDPLREPISFALHAPERGLALIGAQLLATTADLWLLFQKSRPFLVGAGVAAIGLMGWLVNAVWPSLDEAERRGLRWLTLGAALSLIPVVATFPLNRLLLMPSIGGAALVAAVLRHGFQRASAVRAGAALLLLTHVVAGALGWVGAYVVSRAAAQSTLTTALDTGFSDEQLGGRVVVFAAPDPIAGFYPPMVRVWAGKASGKAWLTLSMAPNDHQLLRTAQDTFELQVVEGRILETVFEQLLRSPSHAIAEGQTVQLDGFTVKVIGLDQGLPSRLRLKFDEDPDAGGFTFAQWTQGRLMPLTLPAVGEQVTLVRSHALF